MLGLQAAATSEDLFESWGRFPGPEEGRETPVLPQGIHGSGQWSVGQGEVFMEQPHQGRCLHQHRVRDHIPLR